MKKLFTLILCILFTAITSIAEPPEVFKDRYLLRRIEQSGGSLSGRVAARSNLIGKVNVLEDYGDTLVISPVKPGLMLQAEPENEVVPYDETKDFCKTNPTPGYSCSPQAPVTLDQAPNDPAFPDQWGLSNKTNGVDIRVLDAWRSETGKPEILIGVIDTGIDWNHEDLKDNIRRDLAFNAIDGSNNAFDGHGHGTHVAGIIAAKANNSKGVAGVNWSVGIIPVKCLDDSGRGSLLWCMRGIDYLSDLKEKRGIDVKLSNNSWGGTLYSKPLEQAIERARKLGILFVAAAGNESANNDSNPHYPSNYNVANIISVASVDQTGKLSSFSNYGQTVNIAAPGGRILSTYKGNMWVYLSGTSMATPFVSGALGLLFSKSPNTTPENAKLRLLETYRPLPDLRGLIQKPGLVDANALISSEVPPEPPACQRKRLNRCFQRCKKDYFTNRRKRRECRKDCRLKFNCPRRGWLAELWGFFTE